MSKRIRHFLTGSGWILLAMGIVRVYRLIRSHSENPLFAPHLLIACLSLWIASSILRVGLQKKEVTPKGAISLIRSGSVLLMIWSYRLYLVLKTAQASVDITLQFYVSLLYMLLGTAVMLLGLKISRTLRRNAALGGPVSPTPLAGSLSENPATVSEDPIKE